MAARLIVLGVLVAAGWFWIHRTVPPPQEIAPPEEPTLARPVSDAATDPFPDTPGYSSGHWLEGAFGYEKAITEQGTHHVPMLLFSPGLRLCRSRLKSSTMAAPSHLR